MGITSPQPRSICRFSACEQFRIAGADEQLWFESGSLLSEPVESVAYEKEPSRGEYGISDDGQAHAR